MKSVIKYILIACTLLGCNNLHRKNNSGIKVSTEVLDTIQSIPPKPGAEPVLFETAFRKGTTQIVNGNTFNLYGITIGKLKITSSRVVICDPMHIDEYGKPFTQLFPTGEFPVQLSIAKLKEDETTAFARIHFSDAPVAKWEFALLEGQPSIPVGGDEMHGYGVDGGVAIFIDETASKLLDPKTVANFNGAVFKDMNNHYHNNWKYTIYPFGQHNLAAFSTGLGDGRYATYIGFDASGKPCRLVTDFGLFKWQKE